MATTTSNYDHIDEHAPVVSSAAIEIDAAPEHVWAVLVAFERWPNWNREVKAMAAPDAVIPGARFRWEAVPGTITSTIQRVEPPR